VCSLLERNPFKNYNVLSLFGFATIVVFLVVIIKKKLSVISALVIVPIAFGVAADFSVGELSDMILSGIKQV
jgi:citrate-Mg2+:H+ or citrate-Ca2+:H+ symporter, CitMHS family